MTRNIIIGHALNGWTVRADCQQLVYTDKKKLLSDLTEWLDRPHEVEARIRKTAVNRNVTLGGPPEQLGQPTACLEPNGNSVEPPNIRSVAEDPRALPPAAVSRRGR